MGKPLRHNTEQTNRHKRENSVCDIHINETQEQSKIMIGISIMVRFQRYWQWRSVRYSLVVQLLSRIWLCEPMDCSVPGFPGHHQHLELAQTHVCWVGDAIQPSHPLSSPSPPASVFPSIMVSSSESVFPIRWPKYGSFSFSISPYNEYSGLISFRMDWLDLLAVPGLSRVFSNTTVQNLDRFYTGQTSL